MGVFRQFPYSNFHEMNVDEIIKIIKNMLEEWATYHAEWDRWQHELEEAWAEYKDDVNAQWAAYQNTMNTAWQSMQDFINNYFDNLDVQEEINNKIVSMIQTGEFGLLVNEYIPPAVNAWLNLNITQPTGVVIDKSLSVEGACADAKSTGDAINAINTAYSDIETKANPVTEQTLNLTFVNGGYYNSSTGAIVSYQAHRYSVKVACSPGTVIQVPKNSGQLLFFDSNGEVLSYKATQQNYVTNHVAPSGTVNFALNNWDYETSVKTDSVILSINGEAREWEINKWEPIKCVKLIYDSSYFIHTLYTATHDGRPTIDPSLENWYGSYLLPVKPNHPYRLKTIAQIVCFDETGTYISAIMPETGYAGVTTEQDFTTPENCYYIAVNSYKDSNPMIFDLDYFEKNVTRPYKLEGKTVLCFGDSITGLFPYGDNYPYQIEKLTGAYTINCGFGGCRMELIANDPQHTNPFSMVGIVNSLESGIWTDQDAYAESIDKTLVKRLAILKAIDFSKVDIITIAYGTNEVGYPQDDVNDPFNCYTYGGATRYSVKKLNELYPHIKIMLLTPIFRYFDEEQEDSDEYTHPVYGGKLTDNVETLISVGNELKTPTIDMYYTLGINKYNRLEYFSADDGTHPNSEGRELMGRRIAGELIRVY